MKRIEEMTIEEAAAVKAHGKGDHGVTVFLNHKKHVFSSAKTALKFFRAAAAECEGSEAERYSFVADWLTSGISVITDDKDVPTEEMAKDMAKAYLDRYNLHMEKAEAARGIYNLCMKKAEAARAIYK